MKLNVGKRIIMFLHWLASLLICAALVIQKVKPDWWQKLVELEEKDRIRNFQPPVSGEDIMKTFGIPPCYDIGVIKDFIKNASLDGIIPNEREAAWQMMLDKGAELGYKPKEQ